MGKAPAFQFYPGDWLKDPDLSKCSPASRGIWIDCISAMHEKRTGKLVGTAEQLCRIARCTVEEMLRSARELLDTETADGHSRNGRITLICRRLERARIEREKAANRQSSFRQNHGRNGSVTEKSHESNNASSSSSSTSVSPLPPQGCDGPPGFERFWKAWPAHERKANRRGCLKVWVARGLEAKADQIADSLPRWLISRKWCEASGQYIPAPLTFLNQEQWAVESIPEADEGDQPAFLRRGVTDAEAVRMLGDTP